MVFIMWTYPEFLRHSVKFIIHFFYFVYLKWFIPFGGENIFSISFVLCIDYFWPYIFFFWIFFVLLLFLVSIFDSHHFFSVTSSEDHFLGINVIDQIICINFFSAIIFSDFFFVGQTCFWPFFKYMFLSINWTQCIMIF